MALILCIPQLLSEPESRTVSVIHPAIRDFTFVLY